MTTQKNSETAEATIERLEKEIQQVREELKKKASGEAFREIDARQAEIARIKGALAREERIKAEYRLRFKETFALDADFERLWQTRLRDEALMEDADMESRVKAAARHSIYRSF